MLIELLAFALVFAIGLAALLVHKHERRKAVSKAEKEDEPIR